MSAAVRILHNPRCSKSRASMQILLDRGIEIEVIDYLAQPPDRTELAAILELLNMQPRELMRKHEQAYKTLNLDDETLTTEDLLQAMVDNPVLIERPIVINGQQAIIGRPPEKILEII